MQEIHLPDGVRHARRADWRQLGDITGEAFAKDPVNLWVFGKPAALPAVFGQLAKHLYLPRGVCHIAGNEAAAMWIHSAARRELGPLATLGLVWTLMRTASEGAAKRALAAGEAMAREHPRQPHLYLFTIGAREAARGSGLGRRLMAPMLRAADSAVLPCYLENSNPANTGLYMSHGFERMKLFEPGPGAPPLEAMWREPQPLDKE
jgi:ribosomal protein S18 acetylase RimI-like enzyme